MDFLKTHHHRKPPQAIQRSFETLDWSSDLTNHGDLNHLFSNFNACNLSISATISAMAYDPVQSLLVTGFTDGWLRLSGSPAVILSWQNRPSHPIKCLSFKSGSPLLCCIDIKDTLFVYNLSDIQDGIPAREYVHSIRSGVTCLAVSPAHSHMFLGLCDGTVDCFDLDRGVVSPYRIRNLWLEQEDLLRKTGLAKISSRCPVPMCTDIKLHPFELDLLLISYEGGIVLYDLRKETCVQKFQLLIPPGAIGSSLSWNDPLVFEERRPSVTCICFRPDGLLFVSGHSDGCIAFWSIDDGDIPILVRTMDRQNAFDFGWDFSDPSDPCKTNSDLSIQNTREPIFRIAWSHFSPDTTCQNLTRSVRSDGPTAPQDTRVDIRPDGSTSLTVLGGLSPGDPVGIHVFHLPSHQSNLSSSTHSVSSETMRASKASVTPIAHSVYLTDETPQDFLLMPQKSPYFDNSHDATTILITTNTPTRSPSRNGLAHLSSLTSHDNQAAFSNRTLRAFTFPPQINHYPREYILSGAYDCIGSKALLIYELFEVSETAYRALLTPRHDETNSHPGTSGDAGPLPLRGGRAEICSLISNALRTDCEQASNLITEYSRKRRVLVSVHLDKKIRFWDASLSRLLPMRLNPPQSRSSHDREHSLDFSCFDPRLTTEFPARLDHLTIDLSPVINQQLSVNKNSEVNWPIRISLASDSLDLLVHLSNTNFVLYNFREAKLYASQRGAVKLEHHNDNYTVMISPIDHSISDDKLPDSNSRMPTNGLATSARSVPHHVSSKPLDSLKTAGSTRSHPTPTQIQTSRDHLHTLSLSSPVARKTLAKSPTREKHQPTDSILSDLAKSSTFPAPSGGFYPTTLIRLPVNEASDDEHLSIDGVIPSTDGSITALSDVGFLAIAHSRDHLLIIDLRKSAVLYNDIVSEEGTAKKRGKQKVQEIVSMTWALIATHDDTSKVPKLLVGYADGTFNMIKLQVLQYTSIDNWVAVPCPKGSFELDHSSKHAHPNQPIELFIFDHAGKPIDANINHLREAVAEEGFSRCVFETESDEQPSSSKSMDSISFIVSSCMVSVRMNVNGLQLTKRDYVSDEPIIMARIVSYHQSYALLLIDKRKSCFVLGLPHLKLLWKGSMATNDGLLVDLKVDSSGDALVHTSLGEIKLMTLMSGRDLIYSTNVTVYDPTIRAPDPPQIKTSVLSSASALTMNLVSWFHHNSHHHQPSPTSGPHNYFNRITGVEIDQILAGPNPPEKKKIGTKLTRRRSPRSTTFIPNKNRIGRTSMSGNGVGRKPRNSNEVMMHMNIEGLNERGDKLKNLNDKFDEMTMNTNELLQQAKRVSNQQSSKATFSSGISSFKSLFK